MRIRYLSVALRELGDAVSYYEELEHWESDSMLNSEPASNESGIILTPGQSSQREQDGAERKPSRME